MLYKDYEGEREIVLYGERECLKRETILCSRSFFELFFVVPNFRKLQNLPENNLENEDVEQTVNGPSLREARE